MVNKIYIELYLQHSVQGYFKWYKTVISVRAVVFRIQNDMLQTRNEPVLEYSTSEGPCSGGLSPESGERSEVQTE